MAIRNPNPHPFGSQPPGSTAPDAPDPPVQVIAQSAYDESQPHLLSPVIVLVHLLWHLLEWSAQQVQDLVDQLNQSVRAYLEQHPDPPAQVLQTIADSLGQLEAKMRQRGMPSAEQVGDLQDLVLTHLEARRNHQKAANPSRSRARTNTAHQRGPHCQDGDVIKEVMAEALSEALQRGGNKVQEYIRNHVTVPGGKPGDVEGNLQGRPENPNKNPNVQLQNETAENLASIGYRVEQLEKDEKHQGKKNPDYRIEGKIFDHYVPQEKNTINKGVQNKVSGGEGRQADRIVVNLSRLEQDKLPTLNQIAGQLKDIKDLKEVIVVNKGQVKGQIIFQGKQPIVIDIEEGCRSHQRQSQTSQTEAVASAQQPISDRAAAAAQPLTLAAATRLTPRQLQTLPPRTLLSLHQTVEQWKANAPKQDYPQGSAQLSRQLGALTQEQANLSYALQIQGEKLHQLEQRGERSFLNPLGVKPAVLGEARIAYVDTHDRLERVNTQHAKVESQWQSAKAQEDRFYAWAQDPHNQTIARITEKLNHPELQAQIQQTRQVVETLQNWQAAAQALGHGPSYIAQIQTLTQNYLQGEPVADQAIAAFRQDMTRYQQHLALQQAQQPLRQPQLELG